MWTAQRLREVLQFQEVTETLLRELQERGFKHKTVKHYEFRSEPGGAEWVDHGDDWGVIRLFEGCEPGAVAHELGHGFHECLRRDFSIPNECGEEYAETIRWFAEAEVGESEWRRARPSKSAILDACGWDWSQFVANLQGCKFIPDGDKRT